MSGNRFLTNASSNQRAYLNLFGCFWCTIWSFLMGFTWPNWKQEPLLPILFSLNTLKSWELSGLVAVADENVLLVSQMQCYKSFTWLTHSSGPPEWGSFRGRRWLITPEEYGPVKWCLLEPYRTSPCFYLQPKSYTTSMTTPVGDFSNRFQISLPPLEDTMGLCQPLAIQ
jgi:hypothetical protein